VRTGLGGKKVVLDGGTMIMPYFHRVVEINLKTMKLGVNPRGPNALITHDNLRANVLAQFYIRVQADTEHILNAARSLGESSVNAEAVEALVSEKLVSALRAIASQMDLFEIHTKRDEFAEKVKEHVKSDLEANGLLLESVTISELDQTDPSELSDNNVFDAQGKRKITEITAAAMVERNNLEREAERAKKLKDVETRQQILGLERTQAEAEATQATEVAKVRADKDREAQEAMITQQRQIELAKIEKDRQLQASDIARQQSIEIARAEQEQKVQAAQILKDQLVQMATVEREQSVEVAQRRKQIAIAEQEALHEKAEEESFKAAALRETAGQQVTTVTQLAEAEREANKKLIAARQQIEQDKLRVQTNADVDAYGKIKLAQAEQEAAKQQADAKRQLAEADAQAKEMVARGDKAQQMVAVEVNREQVTVEQARVAVERQGYENRQQFAAAGIELEVQKLRIQADRDVQIEFAKALANFLASGHMTLYGTPETANQMLDNMAKGFGLRSTVEGFLSGPNGSGAKGADGHVGDLLSEIGNLLQPAIAKAVGSDGKATLGEQYDKIAQTLSQNPAFLKTLKEALVSTIRVPTAAPQAPVPVATAQAAKGSASVDH
jgi:flotillin